MTTTRPSLAELLSCAHVVSIPTRTRFRGISVREAVIFDAPEGPSEFSPFTEYGDAESSQWLRAAVEYGWEALPIASRDRIEVNATIPAVAATEIAAILDRFPGCTTAKVKVAERGQTLADDIARVREVRRLMGAGARVRIDANGGWSPAEAITALRALSEFDLDYAEQPCMGIAELASVREALSTGTGAPLVRIAADESVRKASDPLEVARSGAADLIIVKAQPLGGIASAVGIVREAGLPVIVSSALDTSVGIAMGAHLAAALPEGMLAGACGLGTVALLSGDVVRDPLVPVDGSLPVGRPELDRDALRHYAAGAERTRWWHERITRCFAQLSAS